MQKADGINYAPVSVAPVNKVVSEGEFCFAAVGLDHGHIYAMCNGLLEAGATLRFVYDPDPKKVEAFLSRYPNTPVASSAQQVLDDPHISLVASAVIPCDRTSLGLQVLNAGKHYFTDKPGMTTFEQLAQVREAVQRTGKRYFIYFGERLHVEAAVYVQQMIDQGLLGRVLQVTILAPHRLAAPTRPDWFFDPNRCGNILLDIGSHQYEQFLSYTGAESAEVIHSQMANYENKEHPGFADYGDVILKADNGATGFFRLDWFTPDGMGAWGDGRVFLVGTKATVEIRKYIDLAVSSEGDHVLFTDSTGEHRMDVYGKVGFPFFGQMIRDCLDGTETAMTQAHIFESMRLALEASSTASWL